MDEPDGAQPAPARRRSRWPLIGGVVGLVVAVMIGALAFAGGGAKDERRAGTTPADLPAGVAETAALLRGIHQEGMVLGDPAAPVTMLEFVDLQCPFCRKHQLEDQKRIIDAVVRTGDARIAFVPLAFLGPDSAKARNVFVRMAQRNQAWAFATLFFYNQGQENSGYVTPQFLQRLLAGIPGTTTADASEAPDPGSEAVYAGADQLARVVLGSRQAGTPGFTVGPSSADPRTYRWIARDPRKPTSDQLIKAIKRELERVKRGQARGATDSTA